MADGVHRKSVPDLCKYPYPFRAMMSICSDLDETPGELSYFETLRYLNGGNNTSLGKGIGLEIGNTMYFDMPEGQFSYWNASEKGKEMVRALIRSGHIDCIHSFGETAKMRSDAERSLEELEKHGCHAKVWVDHAEAPTNFGRDIMKGEGDLPGSMSYHADMTLAYGIRYIWVGRVTSIIGQDVLRRYEGIFEPGHPLSSGMTIVKEAAKNLLADTVGGKYEMHAGNALRRKIKLRDGQEAIEFIRCNPHWGGVSSCDTAEGLGQVITPKMLDRLEGRGGMCILYTHLGKNRDRINILSGDATGALNTLAERVKDGRILVTTTRKLLDYATALRSLHFTYSREGDWTWVRIEIPDGGKKDVGEVPEGTTFYVDDPDKTRVIYAGNELQNIRKNPADSTGRRSISIPWNHLRLPEL